MQAANPQWNLDMTARWITRLIGRKETADPALSLRARELAECALTDKKAGGGTDLWPDLKLLENSSHITAAFRRIRTMALAYESPFLKETYGQKELFRVICGCLDRMRHYYRRDMELFGNWWDFDIGGAQALIDSLVLISGEIGADHEITRHYLEAVHTFIPVPQRALRPHVDPLEMTGANLADTSLVCVLRALLKQDKEGLGQVRRAMAALLPFVTEDDGFYEDGSFIQHHHIPYAGGYGPCLLDSFENIVYLLWNTPYSVADLPEFGHTSRWILDSFLPFLRNGEMMDMVRGRKTSRSQENAHDTGRLVMSTALLLAEYQPEAVKNKIRQTVRGEIERNPYQKERLFHGLRPCQAEAIRELLDSEVSPAPQEESYRVYGNMDRVVIHRRDFAVGISMFSSRTGRFSFGNGENKKGFHACEGAVYLYTDDAGQYDGCYWPTVDAMRLPGITTDHTGTELVPWKDNRNSRTWVGGACLSDRYGSTGMELELELPDSDLTGKKSWFAFEHGLVCMGTGISGTSGDFAETIVENRRIEEAYVFVDGEEKELGEGEICVKNPGHIVLESRYLPIAYYFPVPTEVTIKKEQRDGCWHDINDNGSTDRLSNRFLSIAVPHHSRPEEAAYSYVLVPGRDHMAASEDTGEWAILSNSSAVSAAAEISTGLMGINFWQPGAFDGISTDTPCSVIMRKREGEVSLGVADPTHRALQIRLRLDGRYRVRGLSDTVRAAEEKGGITLVISTENSRGRTHLITLKL